MDTRIVRYLAVAVVVGATLAAASGQPAANAGGASAAYSAAPGLRATESMTTPEDGYADPLHAIYARGPQIIAQPESRQLRETRPSGR